MIVITGVPDEGLEIDPPAHARWAGVRDRSDRAEEPLTRGWVPCPIRVGSSPTGSEGPAWNSCGEAVAQNDGCVLSAPRTTVTMWSTPATPRPSCAE